MISSCRVSPVDLANRDRWLGATVTGEMPGSCPQPASETGREREYGNAN